ncbi:carboxymuconolactone decarboxylase family protein [Romeria aff. gracilis LEGE 07310]|uniref:Carboxymuconolactone decarboxylase family protein n=1 Tax=Vasconcelosia minhoensis LEGE 07310 TaxID=915328 RepID=A0A8J7APQ5_9CYAN|nr:carboxymuconolactone decarboxylase family protein [Romeria gracilis]MBE9078001.1 carboxymuconolactone decarboxylase family protein [Romeria aff. gracilis LEGE 07310]
MPHLKALNSDEVSQDVQNIFAEIEQGFGAVPNLFKTYAHYPPLLRANWEKMKATMETGQLSGKLKQTIALLVSQDNSTEYCIAAHSQILLDMGLSETELQDIRKGKLEKVGFSDKEIQLVELMRQVNRDPNHIPNTEFEAVKQAGVSDAELVEAYGVMETFVSFNKFLDSLEVEIEM